MSKATKVNTPKTEGKTPQSDYICRPVTLTKDLCDFADKKAKRIGKEQGEKPNVSKYIRDLVREDKQRSEAKEA